MSCIVIRNKINIVPYKRYPVDAKQLLTILPLSDILSKELTKRRND